MILHLASRFDLLTACGLEIDDSINTTVFGRRANCARCLTPQRTHVESIALAAARRGNQFTRTDAALERLRQEGLL
jgi:hypothetical protein